MTDYQTFLASKTRAASARGRDCHPNETHPSLFAFQAHIVARAVRAGRFAVWTTTGTGKTRIEIEWCRLIAGLDDEAKPAANALIVTPLAVAQQTVREAAELDVDARYVRHGSEVTGPGLWVTNYEMITRFDPDLFDAVVLDEACFPAGTPIDTPNGPTPIEQLAPGDLIYNASGVDVVAGTHAEDLSHAVRVIVGDESIVSSSTHPFLTQRGWVAAQDLEPGDCLVAATEAMRMVRSHHHAESFGRGSEAVLRSVLLSEMADEPSGTQGEGSYAASRSEAWHEEASMARVGITSGASRDRADTQPNFHQGPGNTGENLSRLEDGWARTFRAWGQWPWLDRVAAEAAGCSWFELDGGVRFVTGPADSWVSHALQARRGAARAASSYRAGWILPPQPASARREEGRQAHFARVDGLEVLESRHPRLAELRNAGGQLRFYDLQATRHPSYSVAGHLVHNSILKAHDGATRNLLIRHFADVPYRLTATATPAPNDVEELTNQAEFLSVMPRAEMLAAYFTHDDDGWRVKGHARRPMFDWMASWAVAARRPSDLGFEDGGYELPELAVHAHTLPINEAPEGQLFPADLGGVGGRHQVRRRTVTARCERAAQLVAGEPNEPWILWCGRNDEADYLTRLLPNAVNVPGSWSPDAKAAALLAFADGDIPYLVTKIGIAGYGMNFQHCARMAFVGMSDSYEAMFQAIRRCHRFGQTRPVQVHVILSDLERRIADNVARKEHEADLVTDELIAAMRGHEMEAA